ncbi:MAG TPA: hypothetical protein PKA62_11105, partial [Thermoanaerobaculia bacterium]|nr:hypothetical protein [Thermoanaerobaculia bacterium]
LRTVLVPHDGTPSTTAALEPAADLVRAAGASIVVPEVPAPGGASDAYFPLVVGGKPRGVLVVLGARAGRTVLEPAARLVALAVERERFLAENAHLEALRQSEGLKTALLRAVSHDLRSPLTAIGLSIEGLRRRLAADAEVRPGLDDLSR